MKKQGQGRTNAHVDEDNPQGSYHEQREDVYPLRGQPLIVRDGRRRRVSPEEIYSYGLDDVISLLENQG